MNREIVIVIAVLIAGYALYKAATRKEMRGMR